MMKKTTSRRKPASRSAAKKSTSKRNVRASRKSSRGLIF